MFKKFSEKDSVSGSQQLKSSVQKQIRTKIMEYYPDMEQYMENILPKKDNFRLIKCHEHIEILVAANGDAIFFKQREGAWFPTLRLIHQYPFILAPEQVDKGAIKFVLSGANVMCPGLTSAGAKLTEVPKDTVVAVMAEDKQFAMAVGITLMSTDDMVKFKRGVGIEIVHYLNDGLWTYKPSK